MRGPERLAKKKSGGSSKVGSISSLTHHHLEKRGGVNGRGEHASYVAGVRGADQLAVQTREGGQTRLGVALKESGPGGRTRVTPSTTSKKKDRGLPGKKKISEAYLARRTSRRTLVSRAGRNVFSSFSSDLKCFTSYKTEGLEILLLLLKSVRVSF